ncbi:hypothetical protein ARAM_003890 [Aspergillus rambellii]|uniref:Apple domain-containing protein n=3 Tax=Aspergillus subgen. Nidulantes TaxID=2720870 RepID=A0A0F8U159_9EURO|nr:hypothetical protein ARAM_003890 [Aspergillus rambellii]KKK19417.1 hypothetical protein AOCH_001336 [Aspergillus ochraceoroseus]
MMYLAAVLVSLLAMGTSTNALAVCDRDNNQGQDDDPNNESGQNRICPGLRTTDNGCIRFTRGFDVTGVTTEVDLTFPQIQTECDCIQECINRLGTCANYVWKFSTPESVQSGHRTCTLYSDFNLPADVTLAFDVNGSMNIQTLSPDNNPQRGGLVPQAFKDSNLSTEADHDAVSGPVWALADGSVQC